MCKVPYVTAGYYMYMCILRMHALVLARCCHIKKCAHLHVACDLRDAPVAVYVAAQADFPLTHCTQILAIEQNKNEIIIAVHPFICGALHGTHTYMYKHAPPAANYNTQRAVSPTQIVQWDVFFLAL